MRIITKEALESLSAWLTRLPEMWSPGTELVQELACRCWGRLRVVRRFTNS
jgi:hypothetical protein